MVLTRTVRASHGDSHDLPVVVDDQLHVIGRGGDQLQVDDVEVQGCRRHSPPGGRRWSSVFTSSSASFGSDVRRGMCLTVSFVNLHVRYPFLLI